MCCHSGLSDVKTFGRPSEIQILCSLIEDPETVEIDHGLQSLPSQFPNNPYGSKTTISSDYVYHSISVPTFNQINSIGYTVLGLQLCNRSL